MRRTLLILIALAVCTFMVAGDAVAGIKGNVNFLMGAKALKDSEWTPVEDQGAVGVIADLKEANWPVSIAMSLVGSGDSVIVYDTVLMDYVEYEGATVEFDIGVKKIWDVGNFHPYIGGGLAIVSAEQQVTTNFMSESITGTGVGLWAGVGGFWSLSRFNIGFNITGSSADVDLENDLVIALPKEVNAGGTTAGLILGFSFGQ